MEIILEQMCRINSRNYTKILSLNWEIFEKNSNESDFIMSDIGG